MKHEDPIQIHQEFEGNWIAVAMKGEAVLPFEILNDRTRAEVSRALINV